MDLSDNESSEPELARDLALQDRPSGALLNGWLVGLMLVAALIGVGPAFLMKPGPSEEKELRWLRIAHWAESEADWDEIPPEFRHKIPRTKAALERRIELLGGIVPDDPCSAPATYIASYPWERPLFVLGLIDR